MIAFIAGLFIGTCIGIGWFALADAAKKSDEAMDRWHEDQDDV